MVDLTEQVEQVIKKGEAVREGISAAMTDFVRQNAAGSRQFAEAFEQVLNTSFTVLKDVVPEEQESILKEVVEGLEDATSKTTNAAIYTLEEAMQQHQSFAEEDLQKASIEMQNALMQMQLSVNNLVRQSGQRFSDQLQELSEHLHKTNESVMPALEKSMLAASRDPAKLAGEMFEAGTELTRRATGELFEAMAETLKQAGERLESFSKDKFSGK